MSDPAAVLRIALPELRRGPVRLERQWDPSEASREDLPGGWRAPISVRAEATLAEDGSVRVAGRLSGRFILDCRRCLAPVTIDVDTPFEAWFRREGWAKGDEEAVWPLEAEAGDVDLRPVIREELWLAVPEFALCRPDCPGLCQRCGVSLDSEECECPPPSPDSRWEALEAVRASMTGFEEGSESD